MHDGEHISQKSSANNLADGMKHHPFGTGTEKERRKKEKKGKRDYPKGRFCSQQIMTKKLARQGLHCKRVHAICHVPVHLKSHNNHMSLNA